MRDATIDGINNGLGMTGESAKDTAKNIKDIKKIEFPKTSKFSQKQSFLGIIFPKTTVFGKSFWEPSSPLFCWD